MRLVDYAKRLAPITAGSVMLTFQCWAGSEAVCFDDFDPNIDLAEWSAFGGTVGTTVLATNYGGCVSAPNSLWMGDDGSRFAATRALDTSQGGTMRFNLRMGNATGPWEKVDLPAEGVVLEYTLGASTNWAEIARYTNSTFYNWTALVQPIPAAAQHAAARFRWRQLTHSGIGFDHWALDDVIINSGATPPSILTQPQDQQVLKGDPANFSVSAAGTPPLYYQWYFNQQALYRETKASLLISQATLTDAGAYAVCVSNAYGVVLSSNAVLSVFELSPKTFRIGNLSTNNSRIVDHNVITGDDRGGIAASPTHVFYTGDTATGRFALGDLSGGTNMGRIYDSLVGDLCSQQIYALGNGTNILGKGGTITSLIPLDGRTLAPAGTPRMLSRSVTMAYGGIFAGYGRIVLWNGTRVYDIDTDSGETTDLGALRLTTYRNSENWAIWGIAEYWLGSVYLVYARDDTSIVRTRVADGATSVVSTFSYISDMAAFTASVAANRWYFHHEGSSQFGGLYETVGYADATFVVRPADALEVSPSGGFAASGYTGGPFEPQAQEYQLRNISAADLVWTTQASADWLSVTPNGGTLPSAAMCTITVTLHTAVNLLPPGSYAEAILFSNLTGNTQLSLPARLSVRPRPGELDLQDSIAPPDDRSMSFGQIIVGLDRIETLTVANTNTEHTLDVTFIALQNDQAGFALVAPPVLPKALMPGQSLTVSVRYAPLAIGAHATTCIVSTSDLDEPLAAVALNGAGIADNLQVTPTADFSTLGHPGGPFTPDATEFRLANLGPEAIPWSASTAPPWLQAAPSGGTLETGAVVMVSVYLTADADALPEGVHTGAVGFLNHATGLLQNRAAQLTVFTSPLLDYAPASYSVTCYVGRTEWRTLAIGNDADADANLTFTLDPQSFARAAPTAEETTRTVNVEPDARDFTRVQAGAAYAPEELLVRFKPGTSALRRRNALSLLGTASIVREYPLVPGLALVQLPPSTALATALPALAGEADVIYAEPNYTYYADGIPNDARFGDLWGMHNTGQPSGTPDADIDAPEAWETLQDSREVIVGVIDTGVDYAHEDLAANMWRNPGEIPANGVDDDQNGLVDDVYGYDFINLDSVPLDDNDHGTHVAGTIGALGDNATGVAGVCWQARIMALKFLGADGRGTAEDAIACVQYAVQMGAKVLNNSWGGGAYSQALKDAIDAAQAAGVVFVAAAGNDGVDNDLLPHYPSSYTATNIIAVMATDRDDVRSSFSCFGLTSVDLAAPGSDILSCRRGGGYVSFNGTSMATPHVSGACALLLAMNPSLSVTELKQALLDTVDIPTPALACVSGGRLNLARAMDEAGAPWLSVEPAAVTNLPPGSATNILVGFHAERLPPGTYTGEILLTANDFLRPVTHVPCTLHVIPDDLLISPAGPASFAGRAGGPILPDATVYQLTNAGAADVTWSLAHTAAWCDPTPAAGTLAPGATTNVVVALNASAFTLPGGHHTGTLVFSNAVSGAAQTREIQLKLEAIATLPFIEDFETGNLKAYWASSGTGLFRTLVTPSNAPHAGLYHLTMDDPVTSTYSRNELTLTVDLADYESVDLDFWVRSFGDEQHGPPAAPFTPGADFDGIAISTNGVQWYEVLGLRTNVGATYRPLSVNFDATLAARGLAYTDRFRIRFNHYDNDPIPSDGLAFDDIAITGQLRDPLRVIPTLGFSSRGGEGGPFTPWSATYTLSNTGADAFEWTAGGTSSWVTVTPAGGTLAPAASAEVVVSINADAAELPVSTYRDTILFRNIGSGRTHTRPVTLNVLLPVTPPAVPADPSPADGARDVSLNPTLAWRGVLPDEVSPVTPRVLLFVGHADRSVDGEVSNTVAALQQSWPNAVLTYTTNEAPAALAADLAGQTAFLLPEQESWALTAMTNWGAIVGSVLRDFVAVGGVVVALDYTPSGGAPGFLRQAQLLETGVISAYNEEAVDVMLAHPLTAGISPTFTARSYSGHYQTPTDGLVLLRDTVHKLPVVLCREIGAGGVVLLGWDFRLFNAEMAGLLGNAVNWRTGLLYYDLDFGVPPAPLTNVARGLAFSSYAIGTLDYGTTYAWQVTATNGSSSATGPVWEFTTAREFVSFSPATYVAAENETAVTVTVVRFPDAQNGAQVDYATRDGTARAGVDYEPVSGTLQFAPGQFTNAFLVPLLDDSVDDSNKTVFVELSNPSPGVGLTTPALAELTLVDNEGFFDDFDPDRNLPQWGLISGTVIATNLGGFVSHPNALWFDGNASRYATTCELRTRSGGTVSFQLAFGTGLHPWERVDLPAKGVVLEVSNNRGVSWTEIGRYTTTNFYQWTPVTLALPPAAQGSFERFRWRQLSHGGAGNDHWALDNIAIDGDAVRPEIVTPPSNRVANVGETVAFAVTAAGLPPLYYQWQYGGAELAGQTNAALTLFNVGITDSGTYGVVVSNVAGATSASASLSVISPTGSTFRIVGLYTNHSLLVPHAEVTGDDRGGIAVSDTSVHYSGDSYTGNFDLDTLQGRNWQLHHDALASDLRTRQVYTLGNGTAPLEQGGTATTLIALHGQHLSTTGERVTLSQPINITTGGVFSGYSSVVLWNGSRVYAIDLPSGQVTDLGALTLPDYVRSENWAIWGVAEYWRGQYFLVYARDRQTIVRTRVPDGLTTVVNTFVDLADLASFTVAPHRDRWYFHYEGVGQFGGGDESIGYADARFTTTPPDVLDVVPDDGLKASGYTGGAFTPSNRVFTLTNMGATNLPWTALWAPSWATVSTLNGLLSPGETTTVTVTLAPLAANLPAGNYADQLLFSNQLNGIVVAREMLLHVSPRTLARLAWDPIGPTQAVNIAFPVRLTALDAEGRQLENFNGSVSLYGYPVGSGIRYVFYENFEDRNYDGWDRGPTNYFPTVTESIAANGRYSLYTPAMNSDTHFGYLIKYSYQIPDALSLHMRTANASGIGADLRVGFNIARLYMDATDSRLHLVGSLSSASCPYVPNRWYQNTLKFNWATRSVDWFVDGVQMATNVVFLDPADNAVLSIRVGNWSVSGQSWWDDIFMWTTTAVTRVAVLPATTGSFSNGVWSGTVAVPALAADLVLRADDGSGHTGDSSAFRVRSTPVITASSGPHGHLSPTGILPMPLGTNVTFTVVPDPFYEPVDVRVDGQSLGPLQSYTFNNVLDTHTIAATFALQHFDTVYVATSGAHIFPYTNWSDAATDIQSALGASTDGTLVLVSNGVYASGGVAVYDTSNRVALPPAVTVASVNGPAETFIVGDPAGMRCAYLTNGAMLAGFTLTNGVAPFGGGAFLDHGGTVSNCILSGNTADYGAGAALQSGGLLVDCRLEHNAAGSGGGGAHVNSGGLLDRCTLVGNRAYAGGGAYLIAPGGELRNCLIHDNRADLAGGAYCDSGGTVYNCTLVGNSADFAGGVLTSYGGHLQSCIVFNNQAPTCANWYIDGEATYTACSTTPTNELPGAGHVDANPRFVAPAAGNFRLGWGSPCIDAGVDEEWMSDGSDLGGSQRQLGARVDIGAYEYNPRVADSDTDGIPDWWCLRHALDPANADTGAANPDGDAFTTAQEWIADTDPTNPASYFRIAALTDTEPPQLVFESSSNRTYTLQKSPDLSADAWSDVLGQTDVRGHGGLNELAPEAGAGDGYYRVRVALP